MALYPLSYAGNILPAAGIEPATSRLTVEVTHVFTTGKDGFHFARDVACYVSTLSFLMETSSQRWKQNSKRGTIDLGVVVRRSSLKLRHSRCRRDLADSPSRQSCTQWVAGARTCGQAM